MSNQSASAFGSGYDGYVADICDNLTKIASDETLWVGIGEAHSEHDVIVKRYNDFVATLRRPECAGERPEKFQNLVSYIRLHFTFEDTLMKFLRYPGCEQHRRQHIGFIKRLDSFAQEVRAGRATTEELVLFIGHWLLGHVLIADTEFGDFEASLGARAAH